LFLKLGYTCGVEDLRGFSSVVFDPFHPITRTFLQEYEMSANIPNPVCWFEIPAPDLASSQKFYQAILQIELTILEMPPYQMAMFPADPTMPGCGGALVCGPDNVPSDQGSIVYLAATDCALVLNRVAAAGGTLLLEKTSIGEHGFIGLLLDPAGNKVGVHSMQ
jgi:predicted enzyme related to lactoylglutathione lyase